MPVTAGRHFWCLALAALLSAGCGVAVADMDGHACTAIQGFTRDSAIGEYRALGPDAPPNDYGTALIGEAPRADGRSRQLWLELWANGAQLRAPLSRLFTAARPYADCDVCVGYGEGCDAEGRCAADFYAVQGLARVSRAELSSRAGAISAQAEELVLMQWDYSIDAPLAGGGCRVLERADFEVSW